MRKALADWLLMSVYRTLGILIQRRHDVDVRHFILFFTTFILFFFFNSFYLYSFFLSLFFINMNIMPESIRMHSSNFNGSRLKNAAETRYETL